MAKVFTEVLVVKLSKLAKDSEKEIKSNLTEELVAAIEQVAQELSPDGVVVEVEVSE
jgi:HPt (histidine-containing phosphotransfer) domain-containing protein